MTTTSPYVALLEVARAIVKTLLENDSFEAWFVNTKYQVIKVVFSRVAVLDGLGKRDEEDERRELAVQLLEALREVRAKAARLSEDERGFKMSRLDQMEMFLGGMVDGYRFPVIEKQGMNYMHALKDLANGDGDSYNFSTVADE